MGSATQKLVNLIPKVNHGLLYIVNRQKKFVDGEAMKRERYPCKSFVLLLYAVKSPGVMLMESDSVFMTH